VLLILGLPSPHQPEVGFWLGFAGIVLCFFGKGAAFRVNWLPE
jgi:hypothetical protein